MFELRSDLQEVPVDQDSLTDIQRAMNKVRVSVGEHISEPSEVYIVTGRHDDGLQTFIIFYMLEPGIRVVYGFDQNPYEPSIKDDVLDEAAVFVEEMGSILEDVPLGSMTPEQRESWFEREALYSEPVLEDLEDIEEIEGLEMVQVENDIQAVDELLDEAGLEAEGGIVEVSDEELRRVTEDAGSGMGPRVSAGNSGRAAGMPEYGDGGDDEVAEGVGTASSEDVVVAEGDFDELLKQAFLKPDVVEKTRIKPRVEDGKDRVDPPPDDKHAAAGHEYRGGGLTGHSRSDVNASIPGKDVVSGEQGLPGSGDPDPRISPADYPDDAEGADSQEVDAGLSVVRFLSKF
jgi:hypothetical protein